MTHTEYSWMSSDELVQFVESRKDDRTPLEIELAQRLEVYLAHSEAADDARG